MNNRHYVGLDTSMGTDFGCGHERTEQRQMQSMLLTRCKSFADGGCRNTHRIQLIGTGADPLATSDISAIPPALSEMGPRLRPTEYRVREHTTAAMAIPYNPPKLNAPMVEIAITVSATWWTSYQRQVRR